MKSSPRLRFTLPFLLLSVFAVACSQQQKAAFQQAMTGNPPPTGGGAVVNTTPTPGSVEGVTNQVANGASIVAAGTAGTPASGIAAIVAGIAGALLVLERIAVNVSGMLPNSKGSPSPSSSGSAGGQSSDGAASSSSTPLKVAA